MIKANDMKRLISLTLFVMEQRIECFPLSFKQLSYNTLENELLLFEIMINSS